MQIQFLLQIGLDNIHLDKIVHALFYGILFCLYYWGFTKSNCRSNVIVLSILIPVFMGIVIEMLQWQIRTGRHFELLDIMANITGVLIARAFIKN